MALHQYRPRQALSDLSVTEFLTLSRLGFYPHGLVVGVSVYDAGFNGAPLGFTTEVAPIGQAMRAARSLALQRMVQQASALHAEGVVGVRLEVEHHVWHGGHTVARFEAIGTAIAFDPSLAPAEFASAPPLTVHGRPFTSDLSGQDFVTLMRAGYRPVSVAVGTCVYEVSKNALSTWNQGAFSNNEITEYTQAFMDARELAMERLAYDLFQEFPAGSADTPTGIVGMSVDETLHPGLRPLIEYTAIGTAIAPVRSDDPRRAPELPAPTMVVPLDR